MAKDKDAVKITKEICEKVLFLDLRKDDNISRLQKSLMKLPMVKNIDDTNTERLEKLIKKVEVKYKIHLSYIMRNVVDCEDHYSGMIRHDTGTWIKTIYGQTFWEVLAKTLFFMYFYIEDERRKNGARKVKY